MKKTFLIGVAICTSLFVASCSSSDNDPAPKFTPEEIAKLPYSELTPEQQKVKLENEAVDLLAMANDLKNVTAIDAISSLEGLLNLSSPEFGGAQTFASLEDAFKYADVYGIYEWNRTTEEWKKTTSDSELKFIFPSVVNGKTNNATLVVNAKASDVMLEGIALPSSATGTLTVDGKQSAKIDLVAEYKNKNVVPSKMEFTIQFDNYEMKFDFAKATESKLTATWKYKGNLMIAAETGATVDLDKVINGTYTDYGKVNSYIQLMENLVFLGQVDLNNYNREMSAAGKDYDEKYDAIWYWNSDTDNFDYDKEHYNKRNALEKSYSESEVNIFTKYMKYTLASAKEGTKIAVLEQKSEEDYSYNVYVTWNENRKRWESSDKPNPNVKVVYYGVNNYLRFNDNTSVEASAYFSEGFDTFIKKWEEFARNFN